MIILLFISFIIVDTTARFLLLLFSLFIYLFNYLFIYLFFNVEFSSF